MDARTSRYCKGMLRLMPAPGLARRSCSVWADEPGDRPSPRYWSRRVKKPGPTDASFDARVVGANASSFGVGARV